MCPEERVITMNKNEKAVIIEDALQETTFVIQKLIGKLLNSSDIYIIANLNKKYGLNYADIELVFKHCINKGDKDISHIEKVAIAYAQNGAKALEPTKASSLDKFQKAMLPKRQRKSEGKQGKAPMPYLPFEENLTDEEIKASRKLENMELRIQVKNEVEKESMIELLKVNFEILEVGRIFEHIEENKTIKFFNVFVNKKRVV